jgi:acetyl esterase
MRLSARLPALLMGVRPAMRVVADEEIEGVPVRRYEPVGAVSGTVVFIHGGGWVLGDRDTYETTARTLAAATRRVVVSVEYRRAPESRYPAALEDCVAVTRALATDDVVAVVGDSAGGNLAAAVAQRVPVAAQVLFYPVMDAAHERASYRRYAKGYLLTAETMRYFRREYVPEPSRRAEPGASPLLADDVRGVAPAYVVVAECDVLHDEGVAYADRLREAGVDTTLDEVPGTIHGFMALLGLTEAKQTMARAAAWLDARM